MEAFDEIPGVDAADDESDELADDPSEATEWAAEAEAAGEDPDIDDDDVLDVDDDDGFGDEDDAA